MSKRKAGQCKSTKAKGLLVVFPSFARPSCTHKLRAAGVGSGLRSHVAPQRDDFIRRALDVVFRGRAWHFFVQSKPVWQIEDGSKVLQRLRVTASVAERFS